MSPPRMVEILREYGTERMLVNSAADWGRSDPLLTRRDRPRRCSPPGSPRTTSTGCCGATRWSSTASPGRLDLDDVDAAAAPRSRATRSCAAAADAPAPPDGQLVHLSYCTNVHPAEDLAGIVAQLDTYAVRDPPAPRRRRARPRPVAGRAGRRRAGRRPGGRARGSARELDARGLEVVTLNGFPYQSFQAPVVKHAVYHPDWTTRERLAYTLDLARVLVDLLPDDAARGSISTLPLAWRRALGRRPRRRRPARRWTSSPPGWPPLAWRDRPRGAGRRSSPSPAAWWRPPRRPPRSCPAWTPTGSASASTSPTWPAPGRSRPRRSAGCATAGLPVVKVQVSAALEAADPVGRGRRRCGEYVEPRFLHQTRSAPAATRPTTSTRRSTAGCPGPGGCTTTCRCTPDPYAPLTSTVPVLRAALRELLGGADRRCATTSTSRRTPGACCRRSSGPTTRGRAGRRASPPSWPSPATSCRPGRRERCERR